MSLAAFGDAHATRRTRVARNVIFPPASRVPNVFIHMPDGSTHELRTPDDYYLDQNVVTIWREYENLTCLSHPPRH